MMACLVSPIGSLILSAYVLSMDFHEDKLVTSSFLGSNKDPVRFLSSLHLLEVVSVIKPSTLLDIFFAI